MIEPAQLQLVRQAQMGGSGGVWPLQKWVKQCCRLHGSVPQGQGRQRGTEGTRIKDTQFCFKEGCMGECGHSQTTLRCCVLLLLWEPQYRISAL